MNSQNDNKLTTTNNRTLKNKLSKQLEQEQNHRNGDHMEGYQWGEGRGRTGEKVQGISINGRDKIDMGTLRTV